MSLKPVLHTAYRDSNLICLQYITLDGDVRSGNDIISNDEYCEYTEAEIKIPHCNGLLSGFRQEPNLL
jgi:hypothetical protein